MSAEGERPPPCGFGRTDDWDVALENSMHASPGGEPTVRRATGAGNAALRRLALLTRAPFSRGASPVATWLPG